MKTWQLYKPSFLFALGGLFIYAFPQFAAFCFMLIFFTLAALYAAMVRLRPQRVEVYSAEHLRRNIKVFHYKNKDHH